MVSKIFYFHPYLGKIPILINIFQIGWNHHQDVIFPLEMSSHFNQSEVYSLKSFWRFQKIEKTSLIEPIKSLEGLSSKVPGFPFSEGVPSGKLTCPTLAKRNIIFKCAFFRGDVSPRRVDFQQFWDPKAMGPDLKDDWVPWKLDVFGKPQNLTGIRRPTWITNFFLKTCWEPNTSRSGISLGGGFKYVLFSLLFGEDDSHFDYSNIFRMGWNKTTN